MSNADIFLELYKNLEGLLEARYSDGRKLVGSPIIRYYNDDESKKWREELNACREMRNMLSHHPDIGGKPVFEPSDEVLSVLRQIINDVENPPVAMNIATPADRIRSCRYSDRVEYVIKQMKECGHSHMPVLENGVLVGVFSVGTLFSMMEKYGLDRFHRDAKIEDFKEFLPIDKHLTETFGFVSVNAPYSSLQYRFTAKGPKERRVVALFVTPNGNNREKIRGIITPWDMIKERE